MTGVLEEQDRHAEGRPHELPGDGCPQAKETDLGRNQPWPHIDLRLLSSTVKKQSLIYCLSHPVCSALFQQPGHKHTEGYQLPLYTGSPMVWSLT